MTEIGGPVVGEPVRHRAWWPVHRDGNPVYRITGAGRGLTADVHAREVRYLISMGIRTVCFILAIVLHGWERYVCFAAAVVLPYIAVVMANATRDRGGPDPSAPTTQAPPELEPPPPRP